MLKPISGLGVDGWKSLNASLLRAPLCGADNTVLEGCSTVVL